MLVPPISMICLALLVFSPTSNEERANEERANEHLQMGVQLFEDGEYERAISQFRRGYGTNPRPEFLFAWAQAERLRGRCDLAISLYDDFLATQPNERPAEAARQQIERCQREEADQKTLAVDSTLIAPESEVPTAAFPAPTSSPSPKESRSRRRGQDPRPWHRDPAGGALVGIGIVGVVGGAGMLGGGGSFTARAKGSVLLKDYQNDTRNARALYIAGGITTGIGLGLLIAGATRWGIVRKRIQREGRHVAALTWNLSWRMITIMGLF
jgi:tetratricopeptide (TPR) repeat protein